MPSIAHCACARGGVPYRDRSDWRAIPSQACTYLAGVCEPPHLPCYASPSAYSSMDAHTHQCGARLGVCIARLAYLMPETTAKLESNKTARVCLAALFGLLGLSAIVVNAVNRTDQEQQQISQSQAQRKVLGSVLDIQKSLHSNKTMSEAQRRENISESLRDEYILTHNPIDPEILAGNKMPPDIWMN